MPIDGLLMNLYFFNTLFPKNTMQKALYLVGSGANGKSVYLNILQKVFGDEKSFSRCSRNIPVSISNVPLIKLISGFSLGICSVEVSALTMPNTEFKLSRYLIRLSAKIYSLTQLKSGSRK